MNVTEKSIKVLMVIPGSPEGSSMIFAKRQIEDLKNTGVEPYIFYLASRTSLSILFSEYKRLKKIVKEIKPDLIHAFYGSMTAFLCSFIPGVPFIITFQGSDLNKTPTDGILRDYIGRKLSHYAATKAAGIICVSRQLYNQLKNNIYKGEVIPSGVDMQQFRPMNRDECRLKLGWSTDDFIVLFNANNPLIKRSDLAESAVEKINKTDPSVKLYQLTGYIDPDEVPVYLNASNCVLICSNSEGSPMMVKEALSCNIPVVSNDVGDVAERIEGLKSCRLIEQHVDAIVNAVVSMKGSQIDCSECREKLIHDRLSSVQTAEKVYAVYRSVLN